MIRFVTIVSPDFWPGFAALLQSLSDNSALALREFEIQVICDVEQAPHGWLDSRKEQLSLLPLAELPYIAMLSPQEQGNRMEVALQKLGVFALPESGGTQVYIDSDMVCTGTLRELLEIPPLAAACDVLVGFDNQKTSADLEGVEINTGLIVFKPSEAVFAELQSVYTRRHGERQYKGDQDVINMWLQETGRPVHRLGSEWNFSKRFQDQTGAKWAKQRMHQVKLLHFVGAKPWYNNNHINTFRECHYRWMEEIWWDYFDRSGFALHMENPPRRSTAWMREWVLPWSKPTILREHIIRADRLIHRFVLRKDGAKRK